MIVKVIDNKDREIAYGYSPEHIEGVSNYYKELVENGEIQSFEIDM
jgi:predicted Zn-dependent protease